MVLDPALVGRSYPPSAVYEVGRQKIAEFADAVGVTDPVHRDADAARAAGYPAVRAASVSRCSGSSSPIAVANSAILPRPTS